MEKKKLLLVAVSVGVVLLIIIGIPLLMISPRQAAGPAWHTAPQATANMDMFLRPEPVQPIQPIPPVQREDAAQMPEAVPEPQLEIPVPIAVPVPPPAPTQVQAPAQAEAPRVVTTITIPAPRTVAVPDAPRAPPQQAARPAPARPAPAPAPQVQPPRQPAPAAAARPAPTPAAQPVRNNFWVQTGAFSSKVRAEIVKESLEAKGIASIIENRNIDGRTLYRVRVGPYLSEREANYWLALVRSIDGFADSQVRVSQAPLN